MRATTHAESSLERSTSPARAALAAVTVQSTAITTARSEPPRRKRQDTGAQPERDRLPATTLAVPPADPGGSSLWLLLALLAAPIAGIAALLGTRLASNLQRI